MTQFMSLALSVLIFASSAISKAEAANECNALTKKRRYVGVDLQIIEDGVKIPNGWSFGIKAKILNSGLSKSKPFVDQEEIILLFSEHLPDYKVSYKVGSINKNIQLIKNELQFKGEPKYFSIVQPLDEIPIITSYSKWAKLGSKTRSHLREGYQSEFLELMYLNRKKVTFDYFKEPASNSRYKDLHQALRKEIYDSRVSFGAVDFELNVIETVDGTLLGGQLEMTFEAGYYRYRAAYTFDWNPNSKKYIPIESATTFDRYSK